MDKVKVVGLRDPIPSRKTGKVNRSISSPVDKTLKVPVGRKRVVSTGDTSAIAVFKPRDQNQDGNLYLEGSINNLNIFKSDDDLSLGPNIFETFEISIDKLPKLKVRDHGINHNSPDGSFPRLQLIKPLDDRFGNAAKHMAVVVRKTPSRPGSQKDRFGLVRRSSKKSLTIDKVESTGKRMSGSGGSILNSKYFWTCLAIDKFINGAIISYLLYYIRILLQKLSEKENKISWWQWFLTKLCDKVGAFELISLALVIVLTKLGLRGMDILMKNLEFLHEEKQEEHNLIFQERMKKMKNKFKTEKWKTVTEGLTTLLSNIVSTVVNAFVPGEAASRIMISVVDIAERRFNRKTKKPTTSDSNPDVKAENLENFNKLSYKNTYYKTDAFGTTAKSYSTDLPKSTKYGKPYISYTTRHSNDGCKCGSDRSKKVKKRLGISDLGQKDNNVVIKAGIDMEL